MAAVRSAVVFQPEPECALAIPANSEARREGKVAHEMASKVRNEVEERESGGNPADPELIWWLCREDPGPGSPYDGA